MKHLSDRLLRLCLLSPERQLTLWKADVSEAYRLLPMHPHWQIKQVITFHDKRYVDRRNTFGNRAAGPIWIAFMSFVTWVECHILHLENVIGVYVDDSYGFDDEEDLVFYIPYAKFMPRTQTEALMAWDTLGIPHKEKKQVSGSPLTIIGLDVDPNTMTITLPSTSKENLLSELRLWAAPPTTDNKCKPHFRLKRWQALAGWMNWALNVYPYLRPSLNNVYPKIAGKSKPSLQIWVNNAIRADLTWAINHLVGSPCMQLIKTRFWDVNEANKIVFCDACLEGMGFWYPNTHVGFYSPTPINPPADQIFFYEALCVLSAILHVAETSPRGTKTVLYTDSSNTVAMFSSLRAQPAFNALVKHAVDIFIDFDLDIRVLHVSGTDNWVADAISRSDNHVIFNEFNDFKIEMFQPPHAALGASKQ